jgi:hypothetical protein
VQDGSASRKVVKRQSGGEDVLGITSAIGRRRRKTGIDALNGFLPSISS